MLVIQRLKLVIYLGLLAVIILAPTGCAVLKQVVKKPTMKVQSVRFHSQGLREGRLDSRLHVYNPNGFALPVRNLSYRLSINGHQLAQGELSFNKTIPARGSLELSLPVRFQYQQVLSGLKSILQQRQSNYQLAGELDLDLIHIPFSKSGQLTLRF